MTTDDNEAKKRAYFRDRRQGLLDAESALDEMLRTPDPEVGGGVDIVKVLAASVSLQLRMARLLAAMINDRVGDRYFKFWEETADTEVVEHENLVSDTSGAIQRTASYLVPQELVERITEDAASRAEAALRDRLVAALATDPPEAVQ